MSMTITSGDDRRCLLDRRETVRRFSDDFDIGLAVEDHAEARSHQRLVVDDQHADRHASGLSLGRCASTANPLPGRGPIESVPP